MNISELVLGWRRYEKIRKLSPAAFNRLHIINVTGGGAFDDLIDALPEPTSPEAVPAAPLLMQDENSGRDGRRYNEWHASRPDARLNAREAAAAMEGDYPPLPAPELVCDDAPGGGTCAAYSDDQMRAFVDADRALRPAATPAAPSAVTDEQIIDAADSCGLDIGPEVFAFARAVLALAQPAPVQAGAQQAIPTKPTDDANFVQAVEYAAHHGWPKDAQEWLERIAVGVRKRAIAAPLRQGREMRREVRDVA